MGQSNIGSTGIFLILSLYLGKGGLHLLINLSSMSVHLGPEHAKTFTLMAKAAPVHVEDMSKYYNFGCPTSNRFICSYKNKKQYMLLYYYVQKILIQLIWSVCLSSCLSVV